MIPYKHPRCFCHSSALHSRALREEHCKKQNLRASAAEKGDFLASEPSGWLVLYLSIPQSIGILHVRAVVSILNKEGLWHSQQWPLMEILLFFSNSGCFNKPERFGNSWDCYLLKALDFPTPTLPEKGGWVEVEEQVATDAFGSSGCFFWPGVLVLSLKGLTVT